MGGWERLGPAAEAAGAEGSAMVYYPNNPEGGWTWPLTIGFFPDPPGRQLFEAVHRVRPFVCGVIYPVRIGFDEDVCDVIVMHQSLDGDPDADPGSVADAVIFLTWPGGIPSQETASRRLEDSYAGAFSYVRIHPDERARFLHSFLWEVTGGRGYATAIDAAAGRIARSNPDRASAHAVTAIEPRFASWSAMLLTLDDNSRRSFFGGPEPTDE